MSFAASGKSSKNAGDHSNKDGNGLPGINYLRDYGEPPARETAGAEFTADCGASIDRRETCGSSRRRKRLKTLGSSTPIKRGIVITRAQTKERGASRFSGHRGAACFRQRPVGSDRRSCCRLPIDWFFVGTLVQKLRRLYREERDKTSPGVVSRHLRQT